MRPRERGQALPLVVLAGAAILLAGLGAFWLGRAHVMKARAQTAADLAAISAGRRLREVLPRMLARPGLSAAQWQGAVRQTAADYARRNGAELIRLTWPDRPRWPPTAVQVTVAIAGPAGTRILADVPVDVPNG